MGDFNPQLPTKYNGTNKYITFFVTRNRSPTGADYRQPETGTLYALGTVWQTGKNPTTGVEGDLWMLSKIVANVAYWVKISGGSIGPLFEVNVQAATAPGVDPVTPDGFGVMTINGNAVANHSVVLETHTRSLNAFDIDIQYAASAAASDGTKSGVAHFDSADFSVNASGFVTLGGAGATQTLTPNEDFDGSAATPISPQAGNINILGSNPSFATVTETYNTTGTAAGNLDVEHRAWVTGLVVDTSTTPGSRGTFSTLAAALAAASVGQTVFLRTSVTENVTIPPGVNIACWQGSSTNTPTITGTITMTGAGVSTIRGIKLQTNGAAFLAVTGSAASVIYLRDCYLNMTNATGITFSSSSSSAAIDIRTCLGNLGTTGISFFSHSSAGVLTINATSIGNTGGSTTASTISSGILNSFGSDFQFPLTSSSTASIGCRIVQFTATNTIALTLGGSGIQNFKYCTIQSGTASSVNISTSAVMNLCDINSTNANAITGVGIITYSGIVFSGTSNTINTTTQIACGTLQGSKNTAPSAGFLGEQISSLAVLVPVSNSTPTSVANIILTPGVWDITTSSSGFSSTSTANALQLGISTVNNTFQGIAGDQQITINTISFTNSSLGAVVPSFRVVISTNTTYFMVGQLNFSTGTASISGRISAVRVA